MTRPTTRPLSPHLGIYRWEPNMLVSILHRITGGALTVAGLGLMLWWMVALAGAPEDYANFSRIATHPLAMVVWVGLSWAFFQHLLSGIRHLVMDIGAGFELRTNRFWSVMTIVLSIAATAIFWFFLMGVGQ